MKIVLILLVSPQEQVLDEFSYSEDLNQNSHSMGHSCHDFCLLDFWLLGL